MLVFKTHQHSLSAGLEVLDLEELLSFLSRLEAGRIVRDEVLALAELSITTG